MDWVDTAEHFCGQRGWGARGKTIGISRMFGHSDKSALVSATHVAALRPRGILSGFLAIVPSLRYAVFIPPVSARIQPVRVRMRIDDAIYDQGGAIFSAYILLRTKTIVIEDILVWNNASVWHTMTFRDRWASIVRPFVESQFLQDAYIQHGYTVTLAKYTSLASLLTTDDTSNVIELVPDAPGQKRIIYIPATAPPQAAAPSVATAPAPVVAATIPAPPPSVATACRNEFTARKEAGMGPDVYALYRNDTERLGVALVRTLSVSRALRTFTESIIPVNASFNKQFDKWEITGLVE